MERQFTVVREIWSGTTLSSGKATGRLTRKNEIPEKGTRLTEDKNQSGSKKFMWYVYNSTEVSQNNLSSQLQEENEKKQWQNENGKNRDI